MIKNALAFLKPFHIHQQNCPDISFKVPTNLKHNILAEGKRALAKGGNDPSFPAEVGRDLGKMAGMAYLFLQKL